MKYTTRQYAQALFQAIFESHPKDQGKILDNFVAVLKANGDLDKADEIEREFFEHEREARGVQIAEVKSARVLSSQEESGFIKELNEFVGGKVELKKQVDEGLIGGIVIKIGDQLIDGSVKKNLKDLKEQLTKP